MTFAPGLGSTPKIQTTSFSLPVKSCKGERLSEAIVEPWGLAGDRVEVAMPGGGAVVHLGDGVRLTGPATFVGEVTTP